MKLLPKRRNPPPVEELPSEQEIQITRGFRSLRDATAREVMTPRVDVVALEVPVRFVDVARAVRKSGHSHFPVYEGDLDRLIGVLFVKDLFRLVGKSDEDESKDLSEAIAASLDVTDQIRDPYIVPESRSALEVLADMRHRRRGVAVVLDEHGGFSGMLTVKDLMSELVGDLRDEFDTATSPAVLRIDQNRYLVDGSCSIDEVRDDVGIELPDGEYVTLGGYVLDALGHIPIEGEELVTEHFVIRITRMDRHRIAKVVIQALSATILGGAGESPAIGK